jgi:tetratricopeptide (TPR) repeat protein
MDAPMRKINTKFFVILAVCFVVMTGAIVGLHRLQAGNIAEALLWQANQAEKDGKLDRATKYLGRYLEFARDDLDQRERLGMMLSDPLLATSAQRRARARFVIEQVLAKEPLRHTLRARLIRTMLLGRKFEPANEHLRYLEQNQPASAEVAYLRGEWHQGQNQTPPALDAYRRAVKLDPSMVDAYVRLVHLLKHSDFGKDPRNGAEIDNLVMAALAKAPQDAGILSLAAQHAQEKGNTPIALSYLEDGLKNNPTEPRLYLALANIYGQNNKRGDAIAKLQIGLQKVRKDQTYDLRWSLGNLLLDDNRLDDAQKAIQEMREINPLSAQYLEARHLMQRGRWFEASKQFEKIRPTLKTVKELAFQLDLYLGACYEQLDESVSQLTAFQRAAEIDPTSLKARRGMANARWALGQTSEALEIYRDLVSRTPDAEESLQRRIEYVQMLLQSGQHRDPKQRQNIEAELRTIEKSRSKSIDIALIRAELTYAQGDKDKAEVMLQEAAKEYPDRYEPWIALITFAANRKDYALMRQLTEKADSRFPDKAEYRLGLVRLWSQHYNDDTAAAMKRVEAGLAKFTPREQSSLLQAMAEAHYFAFQYADCTRALQRMVKLPQHVQDVRIRMQLLELALLQNDDAQAKTLLSEVKRLEGENTGGVDWSFGEALRLIRTSSKANKEELEKARNLLTVAAAQRPNWHPVLQARGELEERLGRIDQAIANYRRALDLGCRDPQVMKQLLVLLSQAHRYDEVEQVLARMHKDLGTTDELVRYYVATSFQRRDYRKAEFLIKEIVARKSTNYRDHLWMGQILSTSGQSPDEAEKAFRHAIALAPTQPENWFNLVRHLISVGQKESAKTEIDNAAKTLPPETKDLTLAQCHELLGYLQEAAEHYQQAAAKQADALAIQRAAGDFFMRTGRFQEAESLYRAVVERKNSVHDEESNVSRRGLALALVKQNRPAKTAEALRLAGLALDNKGLLIESKLAATPEEQLLQAKVLGSLNHHRLRGKAIDILESLLQKNHLRPDDQFYLTRLQAQQGLDANAWLKTRSLLKSLTLEHPKNSRYLAYAAFLHLQQKELGDAEPFIAKLEAVERERKTTPGGFGSTELRAKLLEMRGLGSQAVIALTAYADEPGAAPDRKLLLATLQGRLGNYRAAIDLCDSVRQTGALFDEANGAAVAILRQNKPSEAQPTRFDQWQRERQRVENALRESLANDPKAVTVRLQLADLMELEGKYVEVEKLCREVIQLNENHLVALNNLAWLLGQNEKKANEGLTLIQRAIDKFGPRAELLDTRAIIRLNLGQAEEALQDLERVVNEAPTATRLFHLSRVHDKLRDAKSALASFRRANEMGLTMQQLHPVEQAEYQRVSAELNRGP